MNIRQEQQADYVAVYQVVKEAFALAPLSILPEYQNRGIGQALIKQGHSTAKKMGYRYCLSKWKRKVLWRYAWMEAAVN